MQLYRFTIQPLTPWTTPWQADTLWGLLCWSCARRFGDRTVSEDLVTPALAGAPPFILSDAFPSGCFPAPVLLRSDAAIQHYRLTGKHEFREKKVRRAKYVTASGMIEFLNGNWPSLSNVLSVSPIGQLLETHNQIGRVTTTTSADGSLFSREAAMLKNAGTLDVYALTTAVFLPRLVELFREMSLRGFGADVSNGKGEFQLACEPEIEDRFQPKGDANSCVTLSTFQPAASDPVDGYWQSHLKHGKLGADFGISGIFKRPQLMLQPGAVFLQPRTNLGRAIPMEELLSSSAINELEARGVRIIHSAFSVALQGRCPL